MQLQNSGKSDAVSQIIRRFITVSLLLCLPSVAQSQFTLDPDQVVFTTLKGDPLGMAQVLAGGSTNVKVELRTSQTLLKERMNFTLSAELVEAEMIDLVLMKGARGATVVINAAYNVESLTGKVSADVNIADKQVISFPLEVSVVEREFRLSILDQKAKPISVIELKKGESVKVKVRVLPVEMTLGESKLFGGETLKVDPSYEGAGLSATSVELKMDETEMEMTLTVADDDAKGVSTSGGKLLVSGSGLVNAAVEPAILEVEVTSFGFGFDMFKWGQ